MSHGHYWTVSVKNCLTILLKMYFLLSRIPQSAQDRRAGFPLFLPYKMIVYFTELDADIMKVFDGLSKKQIVVILSHQEYKNKKV